MKGLRSKQVIRQSGGRNSSSGHRDILLVNRHFHDIVSHGEIRARSVVLNTRER